MHLHVLCRYVIACGQRVFVFGRLYLHSKIRNNGRNSGSANAPSTMAEKWEHSRHDSGRVTSKESAGSKLLFVSRSSREFVSLTCWQTFFSSSRQQAKICVLSGLDQPPHSKEAGENTNNVPQFHNTLHPKRNKQQTKFQCFIWFHRISFPYYD